ncbi:MAG TPA: cation:dicarboxylase symporter family transporter [Candidatus Saccharimonadales bacterium]|nr:cation:dicarboxylase symporter family transporter [Candidatus Saccharimonadales bacterium]
MADTPRKATRIFLIGGLALFAIGALLLALRPGPLWLYVRWVGLALLLIDGFRRRTLTFWIFFSLLFGLELGLDWPEIASHLRFLSDIFLRLIKVIVAPLILGTLVTGIAGHGDVRKVGRIGWKSLLFFEVVTTIALFIGVAAINLTRAGAGVVVPHTAGDAQLGATGSIRWDEFLVHVFPENIAKSVAENQILQVAVFAILFGIALTQVSEKYRQPMLSLAESLTQVMFRFTKIVMYFAPIGVGAAMAYSVGHLGIGILLPLGKLVLTAYGALLAFVLLVMYPIHLLYRLPLKRFLSLVAEPATIAFATSSSEAALPGAMEAMEEYGVPREIVAFVIPAGYSFNLTGSTVYLAVASVFIAQASGISMSWTQQLFMVFTLMLTSKGVAGVPRAVVVVLLATAGSMHLPTEPIFLILGVDALVDMARTSVNVVSNCQASAVIARSEGEFAATAS